MGNSKPPVEKKRRKKGRPSLLDIQKRSLKLQQYQQYPTPNPNPIPGDGDGDGDDDEDSGREKKLKLVLRLPHSSDDSKGEGWNSAKTTDDFQGGEPLDPGPTTPLPDEKLLIFILDRLQKKDTYGVFSEPVDPNELPDYHEIIAHPMDFSTVRKKLSGGAYSNLEQFEKDVFLISLNAMSYNSPETIYFRQARSIHELAKKDFENLRQETDDEEPEPRKRGRPPSKNAFKRPVGRPAAERATSDFSGATLANTGDYNWSALNHDFARKGSASDKPGTSGMSTMASLGLRNTEAFGRMGEHKAEKSEEYPGSAVKGISARYGRKPILIDENRRNTYRQSQSYAVSPEPPILSTFDSEKKQLIPVGVQIEHAYARSLARYAANIGPIGWALAAEMIERALPLGTKFGRGWVGDSAAPQPSSLPRISPCSTVPRGNKLLQRPDPPSADSAAEESQVSRSSDSMENADPSRGSNKAPSQPQRNPGLQQSVNGFSTPFGFNLASQLAKMVRPATPSGSLGLNTPMTHGRALDLVSRGGWRSSSLQQKPDSGPPDLNVQFQSPVSPASGVMVDSQQPDLALQL